MTQEELAQQVRDKAQELQEAIDWGIHEGLSIVVIIDLERKPEKVIGRPIIDVRILKET